MKKKLYITGMSCMHCVGRVENALTQLDGVAAAQVDLENGFALVESAKDIADELLKAAVEDAGYQVTKIETL
jgi:copper ion binding protein